MMSDSDDLTTFAMPVTMVEAVYECRVDLGALDGVNMRGREIEFASRLSRPFPILAVRFLECAGGVAKVGLAWLAHDAKDLEAEDVPSSYLERFINLAQSCLGAVPNEGAASPAWSLTSTQPLDESLLPWKDSIAYSLIQYRESSWRALQDGDVQGAMACDRRYDLCADALVQLGWSVSELGAKVAGISVSHFQEQVDVGIRAPCAGHPALVSRAMEAKESSRPRVRN